MSNRPLDHDALHEDFTAHVKARWGLEDENSVLSMLGDWLSSYQPGPAALALAASLPVAHRNAA